MVLFHWRGYNLRLSRLTPTQKIDIWAPRYKDRAILIAKYKVGTHNEITFSKAKHLPDAYYLSGETIRRYPLETNGRIACFAVPESELELLEREI